MVEEHEDGSSNKWTEHSLKYQADTNCIHGYTDIKIFPWQWSWNSLNPLSTLQDRRKHHCSTSNRKLTLSKDSLAHLTFTSEVLREHQPLAATWNECCEIQHHKPLVSGLHYLFKPNQPSSACLYCTENPRYNNSVFFLSYTEPL